MVYTLVDIYTKLGQYVTPDLIECNQPAVQDALRRAARMFCVETWAWSEWQTGLVLPEEPCEAPTAAATGAGVLTGTYCYAITNVTANGESLAGRVSFPVTAASREISLANIPIGPTGTISRNIYRTLSTGNGLWFLSSIADNVTTTHTDNALDTVLGDPPPDLQTFQFLVPSAYLAEVYRVRGLRREHHHPDTSPYLGRLHYETSGKGKIAFLHRVDNGLHFGANILYMPMQNCQQYPEWLINDYGEGIVSGALFFLRRQERRAWADPKQAALDARDFESAIARAKGDLMDNFENNSPRIGPPIVR